MIATDNKNGLVRLCACTLLFLAFAVMYFLNVRLPLMMVWPLATLFLAGLGLIPWQISLAMLFSACGDAMGVLHRFIPQMASFMVAHLFLISWFAPRIRKAGHGGIFAVCLSFFVVLIAAFALVVIVGPVEDMVVHAGAALYCIVISAMFWCSAMQSRGSDVWSMVIPVGAILFLGSDMVLAWNKFVSPIPGSTYCIMVPYYMGQLLLFWGTALAEREK